MPERSENIGHVAYPLEHNPLEIHSNRAILLPGQDIRKPGMFDQWMEHAASREALERGNAQLKDMYGYDLIKMAQLTGDPQTDNTNAQLFRQTRYTQPAVYLQSMAIHNFNKAERRKGYSSIPKYYSGVSMGMGTAATLAGFMDFETGLRFHGERGRIMQDFSDQNLTSMVALVNVGEEEVLRLLGDAQNSQIDLCLINSDTLWVVGGPNNPDDPSSPIQSLKSQLKEQRIRSVDVDTDRAMHGRYVRSARPEFDRMLDEISFKKPVSAVVGSVTGLPIRDEESMKEELKIGFDHTVDNRKPLAFFNAAGVHTFSEVGNPKGNFGKVMERVFNARNLQVAAGVTVAGIAAGTGIYEVMTKYNRHHPDHPENGGK